MALTDAQWAEQVAAVVADLVAGTITEAQAAALIAAATEDWPTRTLSNADLAARVSRFLARLNGLILTNGPPEVALGELNTFAYDTVNGALYGPKTAAGWGTPVSLVGPPGAQGSPGPKGDQGDQGAVGPKGDTGDVGAQGPKGDTGDTGPQGDTGDTGATGPKGDKGDRGDAFAVNAQGDLAGRAAFDAEAVGFSYLDVDNGNLYFRVAPSGWSGAIPFGKGDKGDDGDPGADGASAYAVAVANGFVGTQAAWLASLVGAKGDDGDQGPPGADGADGADGTDATVTGAAIEAALGFTPADPSSVPVKATGAELRAGTNDAKFATAKSLADEAAWVEVTASGAWAPNFAVGRNFSVILSGALTFNAPTNMADGQSGAIRFQQDATGGRTIGVNAAIKKVGSYTLSTAANAVDRCGYIVKGAVLELTALEKGIA